jgi:ketosteroid isomerase-like protein
MSEEDVETIRAVYERWSEGDLRAALDLFDPHVVLVVPAALLPDSPDGGTYLGTEAIAGYTRDALLRTWTDLTMEAEEIVAAGDSVLASVRVCGVGQASGASTEMRFFMLWTFRGRKVIRFESFRERAQALEAAGLRE